MGLSIIAKETWVLVNAWVFTTIVVGVHAGRVGTRLHAGRIGIRLHAGRIGIRKPRQLGVLTRSSTRVRVRVGMRVDTWGGTPIGMVGTWSAGGIGRRVGTWAATKMRVHGAWSAGGIGPSVVASWHGIGGVVDQKCYRFFNAASEMVRGGGLAHDAR